MKNHLCIFVALSLHAAVCYADTPGSPQHKAATASTPPTATGPEDWVILFSGIAKMNGVAVTDAEVRKALAEKGNASAFQVFANKIKAPSMESPSLDFADVDNDGAKEYVLWDTSSGFLHANSIVGVYRPGGGTVIAVHVTVMPHSNLGPDEPGPTRFDHLFLSLDREGVTMRFVEGQNGARQRVRYLWKAGAIHILDHVPCTGPFCDVPTHF